MRLDTAQQKKVEEHIGLVHRVIADKVHGLDQCRLYTREDLFQIGCIGLCKAAATDRGGCFSTYAYRLIWNEICDALVRSTKNTLRELPVDILPEHGARPEAERAELRLMLEGALSGKGKNLPESTRKGIRVLLLMGQGYTSREIGEWAGASANLVCAWASKARNYLRSEPGLRQAAAMYGYRSQT